MKRFFYSRPLLFSTTIVSVIFLPSVIGVILSFWFDYAKIENPHWLIILFAGILFSLLLALIFLSVPSLVCLDESLNELLQLKRARKVFHAPQEYQSVKQARTSIYKRICANQLERVSYLPPQNPLISCVGIWSKLTHLSVGSRKGRQAHYTVPTYYLLYTADRLDEQQWENTRQYIYKHILYLEKESRLRDCFYASFSACILCNHADTAIADQVQTIQKFGAVKAHICVGVVPKNEWYLPAYQDPKSKISGMSRSLLGDVTFGLGISKFPYKGNSEYTDAFLKKVDDLCNSRIKDHVTPKHIEAARNGIHNLFSDSSIALEETESENDEI